VLQGKAHFHVPIRKGHCKLKKGELRVNESHPHTRVEGVPVSTGRSGALTYAKLIG
jgi:hypothetical protein